MVHLGSNQYPWSILDPGVQGVYGPVNLAETSKPFARTVQNRSSSHSIYRPHVSSRSQHCKSTGTRGGPSSPLLSRSILARHVGSRWTL